MKISHLMVAAACVLVSGQVLANAELAKSKNCLICHDVAVKKVGPAYKDVAAKYAKDKGAEATLVKKIREGSKGAWGAGSAMQPNAQVNEAEAKILAKWVLSQK